MSNDSQNTKQPQDPNKQDKAKYPLDGYTAQPKNEGQNGNGDDKSPYYKSSAPVIELPKGGGALKGIDEKFTVNAVNGTASLQVGLPLSPGRGGFTPSLSLSYNSGSGNTEFGLGWSLGLAGIQRKTDKQLPRYNDYNESDIFLLAGAEDLIPVIIETDDDEWVFDMFDSEIDGHTYHIKLYRPRIEGLFARIEYIKEDGVTGGWWRVISKENIVTYYGLTDEARVSDPENPGRIFKWLPQFTTDRKGNVQRYSYVKENLDNVPGVAHEQNRINGTAAFTNTYLKSVSYCNTQAYYISDEEIYFPDLDNSLIHLNDGDTYENYLMQVVLDYGDHDIVVPTPTPSQEWNCRKDPFSDFHAGFEIRTYRKCARALMFHYFPELSLSGEDFGPVLVRSLDIAYQQDGSPDSFVEVDFITQFKQKGYTLKTGGIYHSECLPPMNFEYQPLVWDTTLQSVDRDDFNNAPQGLTGSYQWVDFFGEGIPGILTEQAEGWFYKSNLGDGSFSPVTTIAPKPSFAGLGSGSLQWQDLDADGRRQAVNRFPNGYFELDDDQQWQPFTTIPQTVNTDWNSPFTKMLDMDGDGRPDVLITDDRVWCWYKNNGKEGYETGGEFSPGWLEDSGPRLVLNDSIQRIFIADMNGDGMSDLVRVTNGEVCYWPNMGYGKFGAKVSMSNAPFFDNVDDYNPLYFTLADISGTGAADLIYLGNNKCTAWVNYGGNAFSVSVDINPLPGIEPYSKIAVMDFTGNGTACIVWSSPLPQHSSQPLRYIDLMGGNKPYLMKASVNNLGKRVEVEYASSTQFYLDDKKKGTPWATRLPFPVHCIKTVTTTDSVSETSYTQTYTYHHGYYDHEEREFRGFGRVETQDIDTASFYDVNEGSEEANDLNQFPVLTKSWFHTGAWMRDTILTDQFKLEYFKPNPAHPWFEAPDPLQFPDGLTAIEQREAYRSIKGTPLRQEIYALDGTDSEQIPYTVEAFSYKTLLIQPRKKGNRYASFLSHQQHHVTWSCERNPDDTRITQEITLSIDERGNVLKSVQIAFPRQDIPGDLPDKVQDEQGKILATYTTNNYTNDAIDIINTEDVANYHLKVGYETYQYEVKGLDAGVAEFFTVDGFLAAITGFSIIDYADFSDDGLRIISGKKALFADKGSPGSPLAFGVLDSLAMPYEHYTLAFTADTVSGDYLTSIADTDNIAAGNYVDVDSDGNWWIPSGTVLYESSPADTFYVPSAYVDPWANYVTITYYSTYFLLPETVTDQLGYVTTAVAYDFRHLALTQSQDVNNNINKILYNCLGMPMAVALMGKGTEADTLDGLDIESTDDIALQAAFWDNPETNAADLLVGATWRCLCDYSAAPVRVAMIGREEHYAVNPDSDILIRITYTDGLGRLAMHKIQAEPFTGDDETVYTWIGSGKTVYNNKGNTVLQYEPYYSLNHQYNTAEQAGAVTVSPRMHYDPLNRVFRTEMPDGSYSRTEWDGWLQTVYDNNDTVGEAGNKWYNDYSTSSDTNKQDAAAKAFNFTHTPNTVFFDTLGRSFYTIKLNRLPDEYGVWSDDPRLFHTYSELDIQGNSLSINLLRGGSWFTPAEYRYSMLKVQMVRTDDHSNVRTSITDCMGKPLYKLDELGNLFSPAYNALYQPTQTTISGSVAIEMTYGTDPTSNNVNKPVVILDGSGQKTITSYDFKGNPLASEFNLLDDPTIDNVDWSGSPTLSSETFTTAIAYDALNRVTTGTDTCGNTTSNIYNKTGLLIYVGTELNDPVLTDPVFINPVADIHYDALGRREAIWYGNGTKTKYEYDPLSYRTTRILTTPGGGGDSYQDLNYYYDAVGNITTVEDNALQTLYYDGSVVTPSQDFTYDALYRLIIAQGREQMDFATYGSNADYPNAAYLINGTIPTSPDAVQNYTQKYSYDEANNILQLRHIGSSYGSYTKTFTYEGNRCITTNTGGSDFSYSYDSRGSMINTFTDTVTWNTLGQLSAIGDAVYQYDAGGQRVIKSVVRSGYAHNDRIYLGNLEIYRMYDSGGILTLERKTIHIADDMGRVAMVEYRNDDVGTDASPAMLTRYIYSNHLGSSALEIDESGNIISYEEYHPYGSTSFKEDNSTINAVAKRYRFTGKERDEETGFYYHGARYYIPWLCQWMSEDPLADKFLPISPYCYVDGNPVMDIDSTGMCGNGKKPPGNKQPIELRASDSVGYKWTGTNNLNSSPGSNVQAQPQKAVPTSSTSNSTHSSSSSSQSSNNLLSQGDYSNTGGRSDTPGTLSLSPETEFSIGPNEYYSYIWENPGQDTSYYMNRIVDPESTTVDPTEPPKGGFGIGSQINLTYKEYGVAYSSSGLKLRGKGFDLKSDEIGFTSILARKVEKIVWDEPGYTEISNPKYPWITHNIWSLNHYSASMETIDFLFTRQQTFTVTKNNSIIKDVGRVGASIDPTLPLEELKLLKPIKPLLKFVDIELEMSYMGDWKPLPNDYRHTHPFKLD